MNVLFVNDSTSNANWGDRAAAISLKKMVAESGGNILEVISEEELAESSFRNKAPAIKNDDQGQRSMVKEIVKLFLPPVLLKVRKKLIAYLDPVRSDDIVPQKWDEFADRLKEMDTCKDVYSDLLDTIEKADLLVIHGDGCMTGCGRIPRAELFLTYIAKKLFRKPVIIVNHTADIGNPILHEMAREVYPLFDDVVFREPISVERNRELCQGRFAPDSGYLFKPVPLRDWLPVAQRPSYFDVWPDRAQFSPDEPYICIGGSGIYHYHKEYDAVMGFSILIQHIKSLYPGQIVLTVSDLRDQDIFRPIANQFNLPLIGLTTPVQQAADIVGNAAAYIGGRWHPSIFALRGGTPIIAMSTNLTFMMRALVEMTSLSSTVFDALNLEKEMYAIGHQLNDVLEQGDELRARLRDWAQKEFLRSRDNVTYLKNFS